MRARPTLRSAAPFVIALLLAAPFARATPVPAGPRTPVRPAPSIFDQDDHMDVNDLDMIVTNHGSLAYDLIQGTGGLVYPKGSGKSPLYAAGIWIGAKVNGATRVALGEYSQEFWPGPMSGGTYQPDQAAYHNFAFDASNPLSPQDQTDYALQGGPLDLSANPLLLGDATIWSVFNDANPLLHVNLDGSTAPLGVEVQQTVCAYAQVGALSRTVFVKWKLTAKGSDTLDSAYVSIWCDPDLGGPTDDLVGCDTTLGLGYAYNATNADAVYGSAPPALGIALIRGPVVSPSAGVYDTLGMTSFVRYVNGTDPNTAEEAYLYMKGMQKDGTPMHVLDDPQQPTTPFAVSGLSPGSPSSVTNWVDSNSGDRRMMLSTGPFTLAPGEFQEVVFAIAVGQGANRLASITSLRAMIPGIRPFAPPPSPGTPVASVSVEVGLEPHSLDVASRIPWVTAVIEPFGISASAIDASSVRLAGIAPDPGFAEVADHDADGRLDLTLRFPRSALDAWLVPGVVTLDVTGWSKSGDSFVGSGIIRVVDAKHAPLAASLAPHPLRPAGTLRFVTTRPGAARVLLFDASGRRVRTLLSERALATGSHDVTVEGRDDRGGMLSSGLYWFRIEAAEGIATGRVVLLR